MRTLVCASLVLASLAPLALSPMPAHAAWYNPGYLFKKPVTIDHTKVVANNPASAVTFMESGTDATQDLSPWDVVVGCTSTNVFGHTGSRSIQCDNGNLVRKKGVLADAGRRISYYLYIQSFPTGDDGITELETSALTGQWRLGIQQSSHKLFDVYNPANVGTTVLLTGQWYHISISYVETGTSTDQERVRVNGNLDMSESNVGFGLTGTDTLVFGRMNGTSGAAKLNFDDIYVDNGSDLSDPGDIRVTNKRPNANGAANAFTTQVGAGGSGYGAGRSPQVNEQPLSATNGWKITTTQANEDYLIENAATGDVDISSKAIVADEAWISANVTATSCANASIINEAALTTITLTTTTTVYTKPAITRSYPSNTATVGLRSCTTNINQLFEAGMLIAYLGSGDTLTSFPVLVKEASDVNLKTAGNGGSVQNASGFDMIFTDSTETTKLDHEIDNYAPATGEIEMWVRIPTLSAAVDTVIYLYYGNSSISTSQENKAGVWDTNYKGVWHLNETAGTQRDSTTNANNSVAVVATAQGTAAGQVDGADQFTAGASGTAADMATSASLNPPGDFSLSIWAKWTSLPVGGNYSSIVHKQHLASPFMSYEITINSSGTVWFAWMNSGSTQYTATSTANVSAGTPYLITAVYTSASHTVNVYLNTSPGNAGTTTGSLLSSNWYFEIGQQNSANSPGAILDEVRLSGSVRSAGWITTEYNDENSPVTFATFGGPLAGAQSGNQTFTVTFNPGVLTVVAPANGTVNLSPGTIAPAANLGALSYTDTLNDATAWSVTLAATDFGTGSIPFSGFTIGVCTSGNIVSAGGAVGAPTAGAASQTLTGADGVPGTTFSAPITLATATSAVEGSYSTPSGATGNTITIVVPGTAAGGPFISTLQYTIIG